MYISKKKSYKQALKWLEELKSYTQQKKPSWLFIGIEARELIGKIQVLWVLDLLSESQWDELYEKIWFIKRNAEKHYHRTF